MARRGYDSFCTKTMKNQYFFQSLILDERFLITLSSKSMLQKVSTLARFISSPSINYFSKLELRGRLVKTNNRIPQAGKTVLPKNKQQ